MLCQDTTWPGDATQNKCITSVHYVCLYISLLVFVFLFLCPLSCPASSLVLCQCTSTVRSSQLSSQQITPPDPVMQGMALFKQASLNIPWLSVWSLGTPCELRMSTPASSQRPRTNRGANPCCQTNTRARTGTL